MKIITRYGYTNSFNYFKKLIEKVRHVNFLFLLFLLELIIFLDLIMDTELLLIVDLQVH